MIIFVDAYNFIKSVITTSYVSPSELEYWINWFERYARVKNHQIVLVFDAGPELKKTVEVRHRVRIVHAGQLSSADAVLCDLIVKNAHLDVLLVTSDREICICASRHQVEFVTSQEFYALTYHVGHTTPNQDPAQEFVLYKSKHAGAVQKSELDALYEESTKFLHHRMKKDEDDQGFEFDVEIQTISKKDKKKIKKVTKL